MYTMIRSMQPPRERDRHIIRSKKFGPLPITQVDRSPSAFLRSLQCLLRQLLGCLFPRGRHRSSACHSGAGHGALLHNGMPAFPKGAEAANRTVEMVDIVPKIRLGQLIQDIVV
jgi:hypothetical protein